MTPCSPPTFTVAKRYKPAADGYPRVRLTDGTIMKEHRAVMARRLGRPLRPDEWIVHLDDNRANNSPENLVIKPRRAHSATHAKVQLVCAACGTPFERAASIVEKKLARRQKRFYCTKACVGRSFGKAKAAAKAGVKSTATL